MNYIDKLNKHIKFEFDDIRAFAISQANQMGLASYVESIELNDMINSLASTREDNKTIFISSNIQKYYQFFKKVMLNST